jgi:SSS family solute:Na+ symporter
MWSVALTDFFQMTIIVVGLLYIAYLVSGMAGGAQQVWRMRLRPASSTSRRRSPIRELLAFAGALVTMMFGSIPQQDVFQRVMSARSESVGAAGSLSGGALYFLFAFVPMFLAYSAYVIDPKMVDALIESDAQMILPTLILNNTPVFAQVMFFGALAVGHHVDGRRHAAGAQHHTDRERAARDLSDERQADAAGDRGWWWCALRWW